MNLKYTSWIIRILTLIAVFFSSAFPWIKSVCILLGYVTFVIYRKNYWFNFAYELFLIVCGIFVFFVFDHRVTPNFRMYFSLYMVAILAYLPFIIVQDINGYPLFEKKVNYFGTDD